MQHITITATETNVYQAKFTLDEVERAAGVTLAQADTVEALIEALNDSTSEDAARIREAVLRDGTAEDRRWFGGLGH